LTFGFISIVTESLDVFGDVSLCKVLKKFDAEVKRFDFQVNTERKDFLFNMAVLCVEVWVRNRCFERRRAFIAKPVDHVMIEKVCKRWKNPTRRLLLWFNYDFLLVKSFGIIMYKALNLC